MGLGCWDVKKTRTVMGKSYQIIYIFFVVVVTTGNISFIRFEDLVFSTNRAQPLNSQNLKNRYFLFLLLLLLLKLLYLNNKCETCLSEDEFGIGAVFDAFLIISANIS